MNKFSIWLAVFAVVTATIAAMNGGITALDKIIGAMFVCASFICGSIEKD